MITANKYKGIDLNTNKTSMNQIFVNLRLSNQLHYKCMRESIGWRNLSEVE